LNPDAIGLVPKRSHLWQETRADERGLTGSGLAVEHHSAVHVDQARQPSNLSRAGEEDCVIGVPEGADAPKRPLGRDLDRSLEERYGWSSFPVTQ
jgi:hypothetical protein